MPRATIWQLDQTMIEVQDHSCQLPLQIYEYNDGTLVAQMHEVAITDDDDAERMSFESWEELCEHFDNADPEYWNEEEDA